MVNLKNVSLTNDGELKRISIQWDVLDDAGKTISTNNRATRIVTDETIIDDIAAIELYASNIIEGV